MTDGQSLALGEGAAELTLPADWRLREVERDRAKATFPFGDYPVLGISVVSVDDPDAVARGEPGEYLHGGDAGLIAAGNPAAGWSLGYRAVLDDTEEVRIWRRAAVFGTRHFRIVTLALAHPATDEARAVVDGVVDDIEAVAAGVAFGASETALDREARAERRASAVVLDRTTPWPGVAINLPAAWTKHPETGERVLVLEAPDLPGTCFVLEGDERSLSQTPPDAESMVQLMHSIAESKQAGDILIRSGREGEYMLSCNRINEDHPEAGPLRERFWHRFLFTPGRLTTLNATFVYPEATDEPEYHAALARVLSRAMTEAEVAIPVSD